MFFSPTANGGSAHLIVFFISISLASSTSTEVLSLPSRYELSEYLVIVGSSERELLVGNNSLGLPEESWKCQYMIFFIIQ